MKPLEKDELYQHLHGFLKGRGVELKDGGYAQTIQKSCSSLSDAINVGQERLARAQSEVDKRLDQLRQVIHEKSAPTGSRPAQPRASSTPPPTSSSPGPDAKASRKKTAAKHKARKKNARRKSS